MIDSKTFSDKNMGKNGKKKIEKVWGKGKDTPVCKDYKTRDNNEYKIKLLRDLKEFDSLEG